MTNLGTLQKADNQALIPSEETLALSVIRRVQMDGGLEKETSFCTSPIFDSPVWLLGGCTSANVVIVRQCCLWPKKGSVTENCFSLGWHLLLFVHKMSVPLSQSGGKLPFKGLIKLFSERKWSIFLGAKRYVSSETCYCFSLSVCGLRICYQNASLTFSFPLHHALTHLAEICVLHHLRKLMANFIIWERKMQMKPDSWCFPRGSEWWRGRGPPHQRPSHPPAQTGPGGGTAERLPEQQEQMARRGTRWRSPVCWRHQEKVACQSPGHSDRALRTVLTHRHLLKGKTSPGCRLMASSAHGNRNSSVLASRARPAFPFLGLFSTSAFSQNCG